MKVFIYAWKHFQLYVQYTVSCYYFRNLLSCHQTIREIGESRLNWVILLGYVGRVHGITPFIDMVPAKKKKSEEVVDRSVNTAVGLSQETLTAFQ